MDDARFTMLHLLLSAHPALLSRDELRTEFRDRVSADDALSDLVGAGLAHRVDGQFFTASRAAVVAGELLVGAGRRS